MRRILFIGMIESPHAARWVNQVADLGWDLHFLPVSFAAAHPLLRGVTVHRPWVTVRPRQILRKLINNPANALNFCLLEGERNANNLPVRFVYPLPVPAPMDSVLLKRKTRPLGESDVSASWGYGPAVLARLIRKLKPDLLHSMEFQHAGYNVLAAKELFRCGSFPKWLATNWGSDIYHYRKFPDHRNQITRLLKSIDFYSCECRRDIALARELGLEAHVQPVLPNTGGFDLEQAQHLRNQIKPSKRRVLMVKGYQHFAGRALTALDAILRCADLLQGWRIVVFSATPDVRDKVEEMRIFHGLDASVLNLASHEKMLRYFAHARIYLGVSASDAISTSMLEAMAMGAFPIQTDTSCCDEWIENGRSGFSIPHDDVEIIADKLREALTQDTLVDAAADLNWGTVVDRLDQRKLILQARAFYDQIFARI